MTNWLFVLAYGIRLPNTMKPLHLAKTPFSLKMLPEGRQSPNDAFGVKGSASISEHSRKLDWALSGWVGPLLVWEFGYQLAGHTQLSLHLSDELIVKNWQPLRQFITKCKLYATPCLQRSTAFRRLSIERWTAWNWKSWKRCTSMCVFNGANGNWRLNGDRMKTE